jgi:acyl carrier protein
LGLALQKKYKIVLDEEMKDIRGHFSSVANLAQFVAANLK